MSKYQVHAICKRCGGSHNMHIGFIRLYDGSPKQKSIADTFGGKELPPRIAALCSTKFICPNAKRFTLQEDSNQIFLVPCLETGKDAIGSRNRGIKKINSLFRDFSHDYSSDDPPDAVKAKFHGQSKTLSDD